MCAVPRRAQVCATLSRAEYRRIVGLGLEDAWPILLIPPADRTQDQLQILFDHFGEVAPPPHPPTIWTVLRHDGPDHLGLWCKMRSLGITRPDSPRIVLLLPPLSQVSFIKELPYPLLQFEVCRVLHRQTFEHGATIYSGESLSRVVALLP